MKNLKKPIAVLAALALTMGTLAGCGSKSTDNGVAMEDAKVTLGEYRNIPISVDSPEVTEDDINSYGQTLVYYYNLSAASDRTTVEDGDTVMVEYHLYDAEGEELEDGSENEGFVYIGSGQTYPELEAGIIGAEVGDELTISITLDDPYEYDETLSGQTITADVTIEYIKTEDELDWETLTDEQAMLVVDGCTGLEDLRSQIIEVLTSQNESNVRQEAYDAICDYLLENCTIDTFPGAELTARVENAVEQSKTICETYYGITYEEYLEEMDMTDEEYREQISTSYEETIKLELIFTAIGDAEGIEYDEDEYQSYINDIISMYTYESEDDLYAEYSEDYVKSAFRIEYIVDWLIDQADISYIADAEAESETVEATTEAVSETQANE